MKQIAQNWFRFSENDLRDAKILFKNKSYENSILLCHQSIEKYLKGVIALQNREVRKTHDLPTLLKDTQLKFPKSLLNNAEELTAYYQPSRYPDAHVTKSLLYNRANANKFLMSAKETIKWLNFHASKPNG